MLALDGKIPLWAYPFIFLIAAYKWLRDFLKRKD